MSDFLTQSALAERLVEKASLSPEVAKRFSSVFFMIVRKGLKNANTFSVYNFGTFKKTWIETTMGLNPQTGVRIEIPAHWRIKFVPCSAVAKRINKKYANLKPKIVRVKNSRQKKVGPDGLYAKASKLEQESKDVTVDASGKTLVSADTLVEENENLGLLAVAENLRAEKAVKDAYEEPLQKDEPEKEAVSVDEPEQLSGSDEFAQIEENVAREMEEIENTEAVNPDEIEDEDENLDDDDEVLEKKSKKPFVLILAGAAVIILVLLISLLVKACSSKEKKSQKNENVVPETEIVSSEEPEKSKESESVPESETEQASEVTPQPAKNTQNDEKSISSAEKIESSYDEIDASELFESYVVPAGGCYNKIAELKYGNRHLWPVLYSANKSLSADPDYVGLSRQLKIPELPKNPDEADKKIAASMLDAYNGYLLMCEKEPDSPKNAKRRDLAARVIVSGEIVLPGFIDKYSTRILPDYAQKAKSILKNQYKL